MCDQLDGGTIIERLYRLDQPERHVPGLDHAQQAVGDLCQLGHPSSPLACGLAASVEPVADCAQLGPDRFGDQDVGQIRGAVNTNGLVREVGGHGCTLRLSVNLPSETAHS